MMQPKRDKTVITAAVVAEINDFAKTGLSEGDLKAFNLHCFSDTGLGVHTCNPTAPMPDGSTPPDEESYCSLHFICAVHLGARYGVGLKDDEPYDFDKSKAYCKKLGYEALVKEIRAKQHEVPAEAPAAPAVDKTIKEALAEEMIPPEQVKVAENPPMPVAPKVRPRHLQKAAAETPVLTLPTAVKISEANQEKAAKAKPVKAVKAKPAKKVKAVKAKPVKAVKAKPVKKVVKTKPSKKAAVKPTKLTAKAKPAKPAKLAAGDAPRRGRPRTREYDPTIHCPQKKPNYWRTIGAVKAWTPDHKLTVEEVRERLLVGGFRAQPQSRMGVLLDKIKKNGGASLESLEKLWEANQFNLAPLTHILKIAVKIGAFSMKGDRYVLGGHD